MAIDTYAKLQSEILDTLNRTDLVANVTEYTPGTIEGAVQRAIAKAEKRIVRRIRTKAFESSSTFSTVAGTEYVSVPSDFNSAKTFKIEQNPNVVLQQKDLTTLYNDYPSTATGQPNSFSAYGTSFYLRPIPDAVYSLKLYYYNVPTPLSDSNPSNAILVNYPDLLLYGALIELTAHIEDDARIQLWKGAFDEGIKDVTDDNTLNRWSGVPIRSAVDIRTVV